jgi:hypothetical protein
MKRFCCLLVLGMASGCTATIGGDPDATVKTITLTSVDALQLANFNKYFSDDEALFIDACVSQHGAQGCTPYANPWSCDTMRLEIKADARIYVTCTKEAQVVYQGFADVSDGLHLICKAFDDNSCQICTDLRGIPIFDSCNRSAQLYRSPWSGWQTAPPGTAFLEEDDDGTNSLEDDDDGTDSQGQTETQPPASTPGDQPTPSAGGSGACNSLQAAALYAKALNALLANEGINITWTIDQSRLADPTKGFWASKSSAGGASCSKFIAKQKGEHHQCVSTKNGKCSYCCFDLKHFLKYGKKTTCRCSRITLAAMKKACAMVPAQCTNKDEWSAVMMMAYGEATNYLFTPSYTTFYGQAQVPQGQLPQLPSCRGSPLVLDLDGDGLDLTAREGGVKFDLMGTGHAMQTAWIRGDNALLALDRNGNGHIDGGAELFGEATAGVPWADGFRALSSLDDNGDGKVDRRDAQFGRLLLWRDLDGDGRSRRCELMSLRDAGVASLGLSAKRSPAAVDPHGNDLTLQGSFTRVNGREGLMTDVYFDAGTK